ncbi:MAG: hypothetical protein B6229_06155 [Spirochaetaceae bacterium 4572_7]|nr:MAG: hypothetical protein B6229_06155 [Spirochaetaceae bacterium 4572_7]
MVIFCTESILKGQNLMASKKRNFKKTNGSDRKLGTIIGSILILLIVVISFVLAPAIGQLADKNLDDIELGSYGKEKITFNFITDTPFRREMASLSQNSSDSLDPRLAQVAYGRALTKAAAVDQFNTNGYKISKKQLDDAVLNSGYYNVNGTFSPKVFKNTTEIRKQELRDGIERDLKIATWERITLRQQKRSTAYLEFIASMSDKKRNFDYVTLNFSDYPEELTRAFANDNKKLFTELSLSRITVDNMNTATDIVAKIENKENSFSELAQQYSTDNFKSAGGILNAPIKEYELESVFGIKDSSTLLGMKSNDTPIIVEFEDKFIILALNKDIVEPTFEDIDSVRTYMLSFERGTIEDYFYNIVNEIEGNDLISLGKEIKETGLFSINYGGESLISTTINRVNTDPIFSRAVNNDNFFSTLFDLKMDQISEPIVLGDSLTVFKLKDEVVDDTTAINDYILASIDRILANYKNSVNDSLIKKSDKYVDNFYAGYLKILQINQSGR